MSRIVTPPSIEASPAASQPLLNAVKAQLGTVPNLFRAIGVSPASLEGFLGLNGALGKGKLGAKTRERIALAVAEANGCGYCTAAHSYISENLVKLPKDDIAASRRGGSSDPKADAAVKFALKVLRERGHVGAGDVQAVKDAGFDDAEIVEIVMNVAVNVLTNYFNETVKTDVDFPEVTPLSAAA
ncbi:MAG: alkylhydroperoxidase [Proteobacteria bacterium SG_bin9]|nr:MAG: alkylhydroperoxidase [Proteobacteria bacterium SG_bin9]